MFGTLAFCCLLATILACLEIEAGGEAGWAERMPTWYRVTGLPARIYGLFMGGKPLTGYHTFMFFLPLLVFHAHFALGVPWTLAGELKAFALYFAVCPMWDYLWFVLNPWYVDKFSKRDVWWHAKSLWILGFPVDYFIGVLLSTALAATAAWWSDDWNLFSEHGLMLVGFAVYIGIVRILELRYHQWYWYMRRPNTDDRHLAPIFHTAPPNDTPAWARPEHPLVTIDVYLKASKNDPPAQTLHADVRYCECKSVGLDVEISAIADRLDASVKLQRGS